MQIGITQIDYTSNNAGVLLHIFGRDSEGNPHKIDVTGFKPYYYIPSDQSKHMIHPSSMHIDESTKYFSIYGEELRRVYTNSPIDIYMVRNLTQHFESDIPYPTRFMIDNNITSGIEIEADLLHYSGVKPCDIKTPSRVCFMDIECSDENGFPEPHRDPIIAITVYDSFDDNYITFMLNVSGKSNLVIQDPPNRQTKIYSNEKDLLIDFCNYISNKNPDIISGWNVLDFDADYTLKRLDTLGIDVSLLGRLPTQMNDKRGKPTIRGRNIFDLLEVYKKITTASGKKQSYRLDAIAESELGEHKIHFNGSIMDLARNDPQKLVDYNYKDVELCVGIDRKNNIIDFYKELASFVGCPLDKTLDSSSVVDIYVLRKAYQTFVLPSKGFANEDQFEGATVFPPSNGVEENIIVIDLKSLYPMCMITLNASPETKNINGEISSPNGIKFVRQPIGLVRGIILELLEQRDAKKREMKVLIRIQESINYLICNKTCLKLL